MENNYKQQLLSIVYEVKDGVRTPVTPEQLDNLASDFGDLSDIETWRKLFNWFTNGEDE